MWTSRLFWKLFLGYGLLYVALSVVFVVREGQRHQQLLVQEEESWLQRVTALVAEQLEQDLPASEKLQQRVRSLAERTALRFTVIDAQGNVLADSRYPAETLDNHLQRPELVAAQQTGTGRAVRESDTDGSEYLYLARAARGPRHERLYVRAAVNMTGIRSDLRELTRYLWLTVLAAGLIAGPLSYAIVGQIVKPLGQLTELAKALAAGDLSRSVVVHRRDELGQLASAFRSMQEELSQRIRQLQQYGERLATVLGGMVEGVLAVDVDNRVILANDACKSMLGLPSQEVVGRPLLEVVPNVEIQQAVTQAMAEEGPSEREIHLAGTPRQSLHILATRLRGKPHAGVVVVLHDVTELRRLENVRRDFVANVSHELKTPLASITAYAETLRMGALRDPQHNEEFVERIQEQAQRLHQLIVDLLHLSRVESGKEAFHFSQVSVREAVQHCLQQHREIAEKRGVTLVSDEQSPELAVWADRRGLATILDNLVDNAIKYTLPGGCVQVRWSGDAAEATLSVADNGIGIAAEDQQRIFERFYRVDKARSRELGGTGLGLAIVKHLTQAHGGEVSVSSQPGVGSTFRVRLRCAPPRETTRRPAALN